MHERTDHNSTSTTTQTDEHTRTHVDPSIHASIHTYIHTFFKLSTHASQSSPKTFRNVHAVLVLAQLNWQSTSLQNKTISTFVHMYVHVFGYTNVEFGSLLTGVSYHFSSHQWCPAQLMKKGQLRWRPLRETRTVHYTQTFIHTHIRTCSCSYVLTSARAGLWARWWGLPRRDAKIPPGGDGYTVS